MRPDNEPHPVRYLLTHTGSDFSVFFLGLESRREAMEEAMAWFRHWLIGPYLSSNHEEATLASLDESSSAQELTEFQTSQLTFDFFPT